MKFSKTELKDLSKAWIAISVAFTILLGEGDNLIHTFVLSGLTVGVAFLFHELGHKFVAQRYGLWSEFRSYDLMLFLAILMSFFGFILAAPGAVLIKGNVNREKGGKISLAGPLINIILAIVFIISGFFVVNRFFDYGGLINSWIALFNLIPAWNFDGRKILDWNKLVYYFVLVLAIVLVFI